MDTQASTDNLDNWKQQAYQWLIQDDYSSAASFYEQAIASEPSIKSNYWYLGLMLLFQEQEAEAQMAWLMGMAEGDPAQVELWTAELLQILEVEAERRKAIEDYPGAWVIRQNIREIEPLDINNLLHLIDLAIKLERFTEEELISMDAIEMLQSQQGVTVNPQLLWEVWLNFLDYAPSSPSSLKLSEACLRYVGEPQVFIDVLMATARKFAYSVKQPERAIPWAELCLRLNGENLEVLWTLADFHLKAGNFSSLIEIAKLLYSLVKMLPDKVFAHHLILGGLVSGCGDWGEICSVLQKQESLLLSLTEARPIPFDRTATRRLFLTTFCLPYLKDRPISNRFIQNQVAELIQANIQIYAKDRVERYCHQLSGERRRHTARPLKIGYLSSCLKRHSVGWLARWIFQHHERDRFQLYGYFVDSQPPLDDSLQKWYISQVYQAYQLGSDGLEIAEKIYQDEVDILVDLDSITCPSSCEVMALKPAPIQVTWLGWDASGLPAIDYFIADPYVLPDSAQDYYTEKIWRLPQTYIAVDDFEVGVPTLSREQLGIPDNGVIYLSTQNIQKRHIDTVRLQMQILKQVSDSYFLIKGFADEESVKGFFTQIAKEEGVSGDRLRFLPFVNLEEVHRANLSIADVVLDTYPYNGATTTLETLWMCIPLVTRVGQQFSARNSYTMMINAGVREGIAWTDEEYVEWGVRLGKDAVLREQISWRLRQSRQTSPLWNGKQFTREMEKAYEQMWLDYLENNY